MSWTKKNRDKIEEEVNMEFRCTQCGTVLRVDNEAQNRQVQCPACGAVMSIPAGLPPHDQSAPNPGSPIIPQSPGSLDAQTRQWAMFLHLSQLASYFVPPAGLIAPIVIWQLKKDELPGIDVHGKNVTNWIISSMIYAIASVLLISLIVGIPLVVACVLLSILFPIIGAVKANNGEVWKYPMTITFIS
jgi:uncharacterized protein